MSGAEETPAPSFGRPLRIAALVKQIPVGESMVLGSDRRLVRQGLELEMNAYCRRAVSKGVEWAKASGGTCTVFTLGPPSAEDVLREAVAWGADSGVHLCDPAFAGSLSGQPRAIENVPALAGLARLTRRPRPDHIDSATGARSKASLPHPDARRAIDRSGDRDAVSLAARDRLSGGRHRHGRGGDASDRTQ